MPDSGEHTVPDPRRTDGAELDVEFAIESYGTSSSYDDPGDPAEITIKAARDVTGANVLDLLTEEQQDKLYEQIYWEYDWSPPEDYGDWGDW